MTEISNAQKGSYNTQIGQQNNTENIDKSVTDNSVDFNVENTLNDNSSNVFVDNHPTLFIGASIDDVTRIVTNLFLDNFPRMQQIAKETAETRAKELWDEAVSKMLSSGVTNLSPFMETDVQYVLYEAQKGYARFATADLLETLSSLISERVKQDTGELCLKVAIDQAISIAPMLSEDHLNYLSLLFIIKHTKMSEVVDIPSMQAWLSYLDNAFPITSANSILHLDTLGCLRIALGSSCKIISKTYGIEEHTVEQICPHSIKSLAGDYGTSNIGTILAILNAQQKTHYRFNPSIWIHS